MSHLLKRSMCPVDQAHAFCMGASYRGKYTGLQNRKGGLKTCSACHSFYYPIGSENPHAFFMPLLWPDAPGWVRLPKEAEAQVESKSKRTERDIQKFSSMAEEKD